MTTWFKNRHWAFALILSVFVLCARAGSVAHATQYGSEPHNHDGKICVLSIMANKDDHVAILPTEPDTDCAPNRYEIAFSYHIIGFDFPALQIVIKSHARSPPA